MEYKVSVTKFAPFYEGDKLVSTHVFDDLELALRDASHWACLSSSDSIEVIDENGLVYAQWTSLYNFIYRFEDKETPEEYFNRHLVRFTQDIIKHFIPELATYINERTVSFIDGVEEVSFAVIPGTEIIFWEACMDAGCKAEDAEQDGILDFPVMKTLMAKYTKELSIRQQRYEERRQRELAKPRLF